MLLLDPPRRLSTDVDVIVAPGTDVDGYIEKAAKIFPFISKEEQVRKGRNGIVKRHFKFTYQSPTRQALFYILLDILYEENHYSKLIERPIENEFLLTDGDSIKVTMPSVDCILGDKLTAFAPHTTGIPLGIDKELEIMKQLYDVSCLVDVCSSYENICKSYFDTVMTEIGYRGLTISAEDALRDTAESAICVAGRGKLYPEDYPKYLSGVHKIATHTYRERLTGEKVVLAASKVFSIAVSVMSGTEFKRIDDPSEYTDMSITDKEFTKLASLRRLDPLAYAYVVRSINDFKSM